MDDSFKTKALFLVPLTVIVIIPLLLIVNRGISTGGNACVRKVGPYEVQLTAYTIEAQYCQSIPSTGQVTFTLDYAPQELRDMKTEVRMIRVKSWSAALEDKDDRTAPTVLNLPPQTYPNGSVIAEHAFTEPGYYVELVTLEGGGNKKYVLRFPFRIGVGWREDWKEFGKPGAYVALVVLALGTAYYFFIYRRRRGKAASSR